MNDSFTRVLGELSNERGRKNEEKVVQVFSVRTDDVPSWLLSVRGTEKHSKDDRRGKDIIINTADVGDIYLNVKSSQAKADKFKEAQRHGRYRNIGVVVVEYEDDGASLRRKVIDIATRRRESKFKKLKRNSA